MISQLNEIATTQKTSRDSHIKSDLKKYRKQKKNMLTNHIMNLFQGGLKTAIKQKKIPAPVEDTIHSHIIKSLPSETMTYLYLYNGIWNEEIKPKG